MGGPRYAGPRPGVRMPQMGGDFNGVSILMIVKHDTVNDFFTKVLKSEIHYSLPVNQ